MAYNKISYIKLFLAFALAGCVLTAFFNYTAIKYSNLGTGNVLFYLKNSPESKAVIVSDERYVSFSEFAEAIAMLDFASVKQFQINPGQLQSVFEMAFGYFSRDNRYVADLFFYNARYDNRALNWLKLIIDAGFDVNSKIIMGDKSTSLFWIAIDNEAIDAALFLLENGASPHGWYDFESESSYYSRMMWPVEYIIRLENLSILDRKKIVAALINKGAAIRDSTYNDYVFKTFNIQKPAFVNDSICNIECTSDAELCARISKYKLHTYKFEAVPWVAGKHSEFFHPDTMILDIDKNIYLRPKLKWKDGKDLDGLSVPAAIEFASDDNIIIHFYEPCGRSKCEWGKAALNSEILFNGENVYCK